MNSVTRIKPASLDRFPQNVELEQQILGAFLKDNATLEKAAALEVEHFVEPLHQRTFETIKQMVTSGRVATAATVHEAMRGDPGLAAIESPEGAISNYLDALVDYAPVVTSVRSMAEFLADLALRRRMVEIGDGLIRCAQEDPGAEASVANIAAAEIALQKAAADIGPAASSTLQLLAAATFQGKGVPPRDEFVEGLIPPRAVTMLSGDGGAGKSLLAKQLCVSTVLSSTWLGRVVFESGPVIFLSAEDDEDELHRRFAAILEDVGADFSQLDGLHLASLVGRDALLATAPGPTGPLFPTPLFYALERQIRRIKPVLVVLDTLSDLFGGDENSRTHARQFIGLLRGLATRYGTTILLLSHPSISGMNSGSGSSGSTAWNNSCRSRLYFERVTSKNGDEEDPDLRILRHKKANYGRVGSEIRVRWDKGIFRLAGETKSYAAAAVEVKADKVFLDMLSAYDVQGRRVSASPGPTYAPKVFAEDKSCGASKKALADAMNRLLSSGAIRIEESGPPSKRRSYLVAVSGAE